MSRWIITVVSLGRPSPISHILRQFTTKPRENFDWIFAKPHWPLLKKLPRPKKRLPKRLNPVSSQEVLFSPQDQSRSRRHELQSKLETLESLGCTKDQIQESPEILLYSEREILQRVERLRKCGIKEITVLTLKLGMIKSRKALVAKVEELQKFTSHNGTIGEFLREKLQCNAGEWHEATQNCVYIRHVRDMHYFNSKVDYLLGLGYTIEDIKQHLKVLQKSLRELQSCVERAKAVDPNIILTLSTLITQRKSFNNWLEQRRKERIAMHGFADKFEAIADLLGTSVQEIRQIRVLQRYSVFRLRSVIEMLLANGASQEDILSHAYVIGRCPLLLQKGLDEMKEMGFAEPSMLQLGSMLLRHKVTKRHLREKEICQLADMLDCDLDDLKPYKSELRSIAFKCKRELKQVVIYLESRGFLAKDIARCPLLIGHDLSVLRSYVDTYKDREEYKELELKFDGDSSKLLNWIQYLIERDINFTSQEAIVEEEEDI